MPFTRDGLSGPEVARAFALIREIADRKLGLRHFDVQLYGGWTMLNGMLAEMETGEGKTLTATLTASTAALAGIPVHVITSNDYLASRDAAEMAPVYQALGLSVGTVVAGMDPDQRRTAYASDITYTTNKQVAFDYLKDRLVRAGAESALEHQVRRLESKDDELSGLLMRGLCFALVNEADSVLIDEARTPLILSRRGDSSDAETVSREALAMADELEPERHFRLDGRKRTVTITEPGLDRLAELASSRGSVWSGARRRTELISQALSAQFLFHKDRDYLIKDDQIQIIDENTGRLMADRTWGQGLHQMIEVKEGCELTGNNETLARTTYQRFFRRYLRVGGMSGTLREVARELWASYRLDVVRIPSNRPSRRLDCGQRVFTTEETKWNAVVERARQLKAKHRAILIGTQTVGESERLSDRLSTAGVTHAVLNARQDAEEAATVALAGEPARITVATNMAGRGTDIKLSAEVSAQGGLHVVVAGRNDSSRVDRQLTGRCARQGDPGSYESILSLEDELVSREGPRWVRGLLGGLADDEAQVPARLGQILLGWCQRAVERRHARVRRSLRRFEDRLGGMLAFSGRPE